MRIKPKTKKKPCRCKTEVGTYGPLVIVAPQWVLGQPAFKEFVESAFKVVDIDIVWKGEGVDEVGIDRKTNRILVQVDPALYRPTEVQELCANFDKARTILKWEPKIQFEELVRLMVNYDLRHEEYGHPDQEFENFNYLWEKNECPINCI